MKNNEFSKIVDPQFNENIAVLKAGIARIKKGDKSKAFEPTFIEAARDIKNVDRAKYEELHTRLKKLGVRVSEFEKELKIEGDDSDRSEAELLTALTKRRFDFIYGNDGETYAIYNIKGRQETYAIKSETFSELLAKISYIETERVPSEFTLKSVINHYNGVAKFDGVKMDCFLRVGKANNAHYLDIGDRTHRSIKIDASGYEVIQKSGVHFYRTKTTQPFPEPSESGNIEKIWSFLNILPEDQNLILAFIFESWRLGTPFPILELIGEQGSAKSTTQKYLRQIIDPSSVPLRVAPKDIESFYVGAGSNWAICIDNMSHLSPEMQDGFCSLATGGGYATRTLYTTKEETVFNIMRPSIISGISPIATAQDMVDRIIRLELPQITGYRKEVEIAQDFEKHKSTIFAGLLELFSHTLRELEQRRGSAGSDRMVDFIELGEAMLSALSVDDSFEALFKQKKLQATTVALESSPSIVALMSFMECSDNVSFEGTVGQLQTALLDHCDGNLGRGTSSPKGLSNLLKRHAPALRSIGIKIVFDPVRKSDGYHVEITRLNPMSEQNTLCSSSSEFSDFDDAFA